MLTHPFFLSDTASSFQPELFCLDQSISKYEPFHYGIIGRRRNESKLHTSVHFLSLVSNIGHLTIFPFSILFACSLISGWTWNLILAFLTLLPKGPIQSLTKPLFFSPRANSLCTKWYMLLPSPRSWLVLFHATSLFSKSPVFLMRLCWLFLLFGWLVDWVYYCPQ